MPDPTPAPTPEPTPNPEKRERCRAITTDGRRCRKGATYNGHLCWPHAQHRHPVLPDPSHVAIPLLEDHASVQLVLSQVAHGLLTHKLDPERARALIYTCQIAASTMPRPPRLPSPQGPPPSPGADPNRNSADGQSADDQSADGGAAADGESVYKLALDYEGIICGDGDLPAPSLHWQLPSPEVTPFDLLRVAPNQSKPTPRDPFDPDTHRCDCPICHEIRKMKGDSWSHPHLQPVVNPYCKRNRPGCEGPGSPTQCSYCEGLYKYDPRKYNRLRRNNEPRVPHSSRPGRSGDSGEGPDTGSEREGDVAEPCALSSELPPPQPLPNPLPDQFPDNDPMLNGRRLPEPDETLDLNANASTQAGDRRGPRATGRPLAGNTQNLLPSNPFLMSKNIPNPTGGYPRPQSRATTARQKTAD